jgi:hypothetical protein
MDWRFSNATSSLADMALKLCTVLAKYWQTPLVDQGYRPELYMRGPGPKWRKAHVPARSVSPFVEGPEPRRLCGARRGFPFPYSKSQKG